MSKRLRYHKAAAKPAARLWLIDEQTNALADLSGVGYAFSFKIGNRAATVLTKTTGITGAVGSGSDPTGVPNCVVTFAAGELTLTPGVYTWQLTATSSLLAYTWDGIFELVDVLT